MEFVAGSGRGVMSEWYEYLPLEAQRTFEDRLNYLANSPMSSWVRPMYAPAKKGSGLGKIRFKADRIEYRPLGFFGPGGQQFTLLIGAQERDRKLIPRDAVKQAMRRRDLIIADGSCIHEYVF